jgi:hypothetical protein
MTALRSLDQSAKLQNVLYEIRGAALAEATRLEKEGHTILKLNTRRHTATPMHAASWRRGARS